MQPLAEHVHGSVTANSGHYIPEEPEALAAELLQFSETLDL